MFEARKPGNQETGIRVVLKSRSGFHGFPLIAMDFNKFQLPSIAKRSSFICYMFLQSEIKNLYNFCIGTATSSIVGTALSALDNKFFVRKKTEAALLLWAHSAFCRTLHGVRLVSGVQAATRHASVITFAPCCDDVFLT